MNTRAVAYGSVLVLVASGIAACSGGGGGSAISPNPPVTGPTNTPLSGPTGTLTLTIPRNTSNPQLEAARFSASVAITREHMRTIFARQRMTER